MAFFEGLVKGLKVVSKKLAPRLIGPFEIDHVTNPSAVHLKLPDSLKIHSTFHVSLIKPVLSLVPCPLLQLLLHPLVLSTTILPIQSGGCWKCAVGAAGGSIWWTGREMGLRSVAGCRVCQDPVTNPGLRCEKQSLSKLSYE